MRELERRVLLTVLDRKWREHLYEMDYLREGIGLRAMAQRDPLVEYQREGGDMFNLMMEAFMEEVVGFVFHLEVEVQEARRLGVVTDSDGQAVQIGSDRPQTASRNGHDRDVIWSSPDPTPTAQAWRCTCSSRTRSLNRRPAESRSRRQAGRRSEPRAWPVRPDLAAPLSYSAPAEDGSVTTAGKTASKADDPYRRRGPQRAVPMRLRQEVQDVPRPARRRLAAAPAAVPATRPSR